MANKSQKFSEAVEELEKILREIESGELGIDDLASKVKRATSLIEFCNNTLKKTEDDLEKILGKLD